MDAIESIFRHFQMNTVDVQRKLNDDSSASALFDMLLFYESTSLLNCSRNTMGASAWISLSQLVKRSERLHTLNASYNHIPDAVIPPFSRALRSSLNLSVLHLEGCHLTGRSIALICAGLRTNQTLTELHLMDNKLTIPDTQHIRALLTLSKTLTLLDLRNNQIQDSGLFHLCDGLKHANCKLETLCLWNNQLTAVAMAPLTEALLENKTLSMLNLGQNAIMDQGASTLKMGLQGNSTLRRLGLVGCKLSDCGVIAIAEYLAESSAIQRLDLRNNDISLGGLMALSLSARENKSAKRIDLDKPAKDPDLPQELLQRQNELWDDLGLYAMRNRGAEMTRTMSEATVTSPAAQNGEHQTIEFDYRDEPTQLCSKPIPISPKQALDELDVEKSLPPASPPKDEEGSLPLESEENPLDLHVSRDEVDTHEKFDVQSEGLSE
ncbi:Oidioi.mRNA.OKI2018_I69.chr1.g2957.t1.cds [Oikopleura dioica]|uniref:Protein phosphatase 1 regulatory subunit 37 n=1 Tax=Oikopleura dioica TaxID=34765 RepID=A0ABN7SWJ9_OIKDI|nr:Oidioi.mRNA.OKI2018_I69.chr1.g2957.t1.cds [Oikopleura dioica]